MVIFMIISLMKIIKGLLAGARDLVADEATMIQDDHVLVKDQPKSDDHSLDEDPDHHRSPDWCQQSRAEGLVAD